MKTSNWQLSTPLDAILFDCDSTLSQIEGIDFLADACGVGNEVKELTELAMGTTGINPDLYQKRLDLIRPLRQSVNQLGQTYYEHKSPDIEAVIEIFKKLNKKIFILSAGLLPAVIDFAKLIHVDEKNVFAVDIFFDDKGNYADFDHSSPLVHNHGKQEIVARIKSQYKELAYIGDGMNDLTVRHDVTRFIGYGGTVYRANIAAQCEFYIKEASFLSLLPLCLTQKEENKLDIHEKKLYLQGMQDFTQTNQ